MLISHRQKSILTAFGYLYYINCFPGNLQKSFYLKKKKTFLIKIIYKQSYLGYVLEYPDNFSTALIAQGDRA